MVNVLNNETELLFTDVSVNTQTGVGFGAMLQIKDISFCNYSKVMINRFNHTSSTRLELEVFLWALGMIDTAIPITAFTDSQNIVNLPSRRHALERNNYCSARGDLLNNADLYQHFFKVLDQRKIQIIKIKGHKPSSQKDAYDDCFSQVDRAARLAGKQHKS